MGRRYLKRNLSYWIPIKKKEHVNTVEARMNATFQMSLRYTLWVGQMCSLSPVTGIFSNNVSDVKFVPSAWRCIYTYISIIGQFIGFILTLINAFGLKTTLSATTYIVVYGSAFISISTFLNVARKWSSLVQHVAYVEEMDPSSDSALKMKCDFACFIIMFLSFVEHILSLMHSYANGEICHPTASLHEGFVRDAYPWLFNFVPYYPPLGVFTQFLHIQASAVWNFSGIFVICMSYYLTSRLNHVNKKLLAAQGKYLPEIFWRGRREDYTRVSQLVRKFDDVISGVVFSTFANNLFFVCLQLYNTLQDGISGTGECSSPEHGSTLLAGYEGAAFHSFSLVYLIMRSIAVSLIAADVHSASLVPAIVLYDVPAAVYGVEVQRFLEQVNGDRVALTGLQFFNITRGLLLNVVGTIVTYELVMFQFNSPPSSNNSTNFNLTIF